MVPAGILFHVPYVLMHSICLHKAFELWLLYDVRIRVLVFDVLKVYKLEWWNDFDADIHIEVWGMYVYITNIKYISYGSLHYG